MTCIVSARFDVEMDVGQLAARTRETLIREDVVATMAQLPAGADPWDDRRLLRLADMGLTTLCVPRHDGGAGLPAVHAVTIIEEVGRVLLPESLTATNLAMVVLADCGSPIGVSSDVASGSRRIGWVGAALSPAGGALWGQAEMIDAGRPSLLVGASADGTAWLLDAADAGREVVDDRDVSCPVVRVCLDETAVVATWDTSVGWTRLGELGTVMYAAEAVGAMAALVETTVRYVADPARFGRHVGGFQAVKRHCADMWSTTDLARTMVRTAAKSLDTDPDRARGDVAAAASFVASAFSDVTRTAVRLHGGMGHVLENNCHFFVRRALVSRRLLGDHAARRRTLLRAVRRGGLALAR
jgi:alkylation response protein AidB-like acyl-CoA dehydrogenase